MRSKSAGVPILGTTPDAIDLAEDRDRFAKLLKKLKLRQPENGIARSAAEARKIAKKIGFPVVIRPSYVLGGRAMEIVRDEEQLDRYITEAVVVSGDSPVLIDNYLVRTPSKSMSTRSADGKDVFIAGVMEHIEEAGIHSGDSACSLPPYSLKAPVIAEIETQTQRTGAGARRRRPHECAVRHQGRRRSMSSRSIRAPRAPCLSSPR